MVTLNWANNKNEISNGAGVQLNGTKGINLAGGLNPKELLEGAVALCLSITLEKVLERDEIQVDLNQLQIHVNASKTEGTENRFSHFQVDVQFPDGLEEKYRKKLLKVIERGCTISNTLQGDVTVELQEK